MSTVHASEVLDDACLFGASLHHCSYPARVRDDGGFCLGYGVSILSAVLGAAESARHILLHIQPGDPGYGSKAFGLSTYTWAFITFTIVIAFCGVMMTFAPWLTPRGVKAHAISTVIMWLFALIVVANLVMIVFLEGLHFLLPGDPACYELVQNCSPR